MFGELERHVLKGCVRIHKNPCRRRQRAQEMCIGLEHEDTDRVEDIDIVGRGLQDDSPVPLETSKEGEEKKYGLSCAEVNGNVLRRRRRTLSYLCLDSQ